MKFIQTAIPAEIKNAGNNYTYEVFGQGNGEYSIKINVQWSRELMIVGMT